MPGGPSRQLFLNGLSGHHNILAEPLVKHLDLATAALLALSVATACSSPSTPTPVPVAPVLACPADQRVISATNQAMTVIYPKPSLTGGVLPITTTCAPAQGDVFALGSTPVSCTTTDAQRQTSSCTFVVSVLPGTTLAATRVLAFGDSITEGKINSLVAPLSTIGCPNDATAQTWSYPRVLASSLGTQYPSQTVPVTDCGVGGEQASQALVRLPGVLALANYDVVLLMEGANDLNEESLIGGSRQTAVDRVSGAVASMIRAARPGRTVFVGTLLPERLGGKAARPDWVEPVNARLRTLVPAEGAILVDLYQAFGGSPDPYIGPDGLHPTIAGYQKIADTFFAAIRATLEKKTPDTTARAFSQSAPFVTRGALAVPR